MGTNYYLTTEEGEELHIGKSSVGWCFSLHVIPERGIDTLAEWKYLWFRAGSQIRDEYNREIAIFEMDKIVAGRGWDRDWDDTKWWRALTHSEEEFHRRNCSERGPNGLLRHQLDGRHCVGHGEGTWDYIAGEFS
jgi:hypothetical protein